MVAAVMQLTVATPQQAEAEGARCLKSKMIEEDLG
jgi:hypothetical protein